ncbi:MAG: thioredoxin family protein [Planctomycetota bacterium]|nr:thioredoxin family protein [Planctomycetota bacterium]
MIRIAVLSGVLCGILGHVSAVLAAEVGWHSDFNEAERLAKQLNRPLLIHFSAEWCGPCRRMERTVLNSTAVLTQIASSTVAVKVDSDKRRDLVQRYGIRSLPTDIIVDGFSGRVLAKSEGFQSQKEYLSQLARIDTRRQNSNATQIVRNERPVTPARAAAGGVETANTVSAEPAKVVVGLDRYSPVSLYNGRKWERGLAEFAAEYKGVTYYLASATEFSAFQSSPGKFAPQLLGCDPVVLWETDRAVPGTTAYGAYFDGELYLFATTESRTQFKKNPFRYTRTRQVLKLDQIERTRLR